MNLFGILQNIGPSPAQGWRTSSSTDGIVLCTPHPPLVEEVAPDASSCTNNNENRENDTGDGTTIEAVVNRTPTMGGARVAAPVTVCS